MCRKLFLSCFSVAAAVAFSATVQAATSGVSLDLFYNGNSSANAGSWQLLATGSDSGVAGLATQLTGGPTAATFLAPSGPGFEPTFGGKPFDTDTDANAATLDMLIGQVPVASPGPQTLLYNAGAGYVDLLNNTVDPSGSSMNGAVVLAFGTFPAGSAPVLGATGVNIFTAQGTSADPPASGSIVAATVTPQTRTNLATLAADANLDGAVTASGDGSALLGSLGSGTPKLWQDGDFNADKTVTASGDGSILLGALGPDAAAAGSAHMHMNFDTNTLTVDASLVASVSILSNDGTDILLAGADTEVNDGNFTFFGATIDHPDNQDLTWFSLSDSFGFFPGSGEETFALDAVFDSSVNAGNALDKVQIRYQTVGNQPMAGTIEVIGTVIPEPTSLVLFALGGLLLMPRRRSA